MQDAFVYESRNPAAEDGNSDVETNVHAVTAHGHHEDSDDDSSYESHFSGESQAVTMPMHDASEFISETHEHEPQTFLGSTVLGSLAGSIGAIRHKPSAVSMNESFAETAPDVDEDEGLSLIHI